MKYTKDQRIDIGRRVFTHEISRLEAITKYDICSTSLDKYIREYKIANGIPTEQQPDGTLHSNPAHSVLQNLPIDIEAYKAMSKEELIDELIRAKVNEARAKKGYEVKGVGASKEFISLNNKNTKS